MEHSVRLPEIGVLEGRQNFVVERCRGKRVLHIGCVDAGLLEERFRAGQLMHQRLASVANELWGLDINPEGITFLRQQGFQNRLCGDFSDLELSQRELLRARPFEVIVAAEVIEHLMNPGLFLATARLLMAGRQSELIVSVPNAFRLDTLIGLFRGVENVHPDHNYWFSYNTATNILCKAGFSPDEVYLYAFESPKVLRRRQRAQDTHLLYKGVPPSPRQGISSDQRASGERSLKRRILASLLYRYSPFWADGLILVSTLKECESWTPPG